MTRGPDKEGSRRIVSLCVQMNEYILKEPLQQCRRKQFILFLFQTGNNVTFVTGENRCVACCYTFASLMHCYTRTTVYRISQRKQNRADTQSSALFFWFHLGRLFTLNFEIVYLVYTQQLSLEYLVNEDDAVSNCNSDLTNQHLLFMLQMNFPFATHTLLKLFTGSSGQWMMATSFLLPALLFFSAHLKKTMPLEIGAILETQGLDWHINGSSSIHF